MYILGIESSCDDCSLALVDSHGQVFKQISYSQVEIHRAFGGVLPEVASRSHEEKIDELAQQLLADENMEGNKISKVAATCGPGLVGSLLVGANYGIGLSQGWGVPFVGVHHLRGHIASVFADREYKSIEDQEKNLFPAMVLLVSGGHTQLLEVFPGLHCRKIMESSDDAAGECFDKSAKLMGLEYPGGPEIEKLASQSSEGTKARDLSQELPRPKSKAGFSFSGLKTAIRLKIEKNPALAKDPDFCWAIQDCIKDVFIRALARCKKEGRFEMKGVASKRLIFCGGVSANRYIRTNIEAWAKLNEIDLLIPSLEYCTDNAAMIACAAWIQDPECNVEGVSARLPVEIG